MHLPIWLFYAVIALVFWGITGVTQKLSTNAISTHLSFLWFVYSTIVIAVVTVPIQWHMTARVFWLAVIGGALNGLGALTSFAAFEKGGKASIVVPLCYLFPVVTVVLAMTFLHESLTRTQAIGIALALAAAVLLSQEAPPKSEPPA